MADWHIGLGIADANDWVREHPLEANYHRVAVPESLVAGAGTWPDDQQSIEIAFPPAAANWIAVNAWALFESADAVGPRHWEYLEPGAGVKGFTEVKLERQAKLELTSQIKIGHHARGPRLWTPRSTPARQIPRIPRALDPFNPDDNN